MASEELSGQVIDSRSRWAYGGSAIVTESTVLTPDGDRVRVQQLGGTVDKIGMIAYHAPLVIEAGDEVRLEVARSRTATGRHVRLVRAVQELKRPQSEPKDGFERSSFARTVNETGASIFWGSGCVFLSYDSAGTTHIAGTMEVDVMDDVVQRWQNDTSSCSFLEFVIDGPEDREVGFDGINLILAREDRWCRPATDDDPEECYDSAAAGLTTLFFIDDADSSRNGEILDADIELNGVHFAISANGQTTQPDDDCKADLANTLTHEIGHLMGLDHTCWSGGTRLRDDQGNLVPSCTGNLSSTVEEATMFNFQSCGETKKASPEADDIAGVCAIYPPAEDPGTCKRAELSPAGCCSVAERSGHEPDGTVAGLAGLVGLILVLLRRLAGARRAVGR